MNTIIHDIKEKCLESKNEEFVLALENEIKKGATGTEITMLVGKLLKDLLHTNTDLSKILASDIRKYLKECNHIGIVIF
ncbi:MAG TPA: hypothetical protein VIY47_15165 [Ignavibacteriaceae bacterium]